VAEEAGPSRGYLLLSRLAAVLVALAGVAVLVAGLQRTSAFGGDPELVGRPPAITQPILVTAPGMTELAGARLRVRAASSAVSVPVFIGVGRADDVEAYLGRVSRAEVTALEEDGSLRIATSGAETSLPDPAGVDVWAASVRAAGVATLTWPRTPGPWRLVVATDGRTPATVAEFTWTGHAGTSPAPALIAVGAVLAAVGIAALLAMRSGRVPAAIGRGRAPRPPGPGEPRPSRGRRVAVDVPGEAPPSRAPFDGPFDPAVSPRRAARQSAEAELALRRPRPPAADDRPDGDRPDGDRPAGDRPDGDAPSDPVETPPTDDGEDRPPAVLPFRRTAASGSSGGAAARASAPHGEDDGSDA
jgi:hypothetical protein